MKILDHISRYRDLHFEGYGIFLCLLSLRFYWMIPLLIGYLFLMRRKMRWNLLLVICFIVIIQFTLISQRKIPEKIKDQVRVSQVTQTTDYDMVFINYQWMKFRFYANTDKYSKGDIIFIEADVSAFRGRTLYFGFNTKDYFLSQGVYGELNIKSIDTIRRGPSIFNLRNKLQKSLYNLSSRDYIEAFVFGENSISLEHKSTYQSLGILFLFSISGLHLYGLTYLIKKLMFYFNLNQKTQKIVIFSIYVMCLYLYDFSMTILRITILFLLHWINDRFYMKWTHLDLIQCTFLCIILINPYMVYHQGFLIVYLILNCMALLKPILNGSPWVKKIKLTGLIQLILIPFKSIHYLSVLILMPIIVVFLSGPAFMLAIMTILIPKLDTFYRLMMDRFFTWINIISDYGLKFSLPALFPFEIMIYFIALITLFYVKKIKLKIIGISIIFSLFIFHFVIPYAPKIKVMMLDVGQGDSFYFESSDCKMMIDSYRGSVDFLQNRGIYHLDYLFLTHSDIDHMMEAEEMAKNINVKKIGISPFEEYPHMNAPIMPLNQGESITCGLFHIDVLGPIKSYPNDNDNSLVLQIKIYDKIFLFTGDIESKAEEDLINTYGYTLKSDVLKISHHGSITSSTTAFIQLVSPKMAWISVGNDNRFGFPHEEIIQRLKVYSIEIYRTDHDGMVILEYDEKRRKWFVRLPFKDDF